MILRFEEFEIDTGRYELRHQGRLRPVEPMVFDLIAHFARHPGQLMTRDDLVGRLWNGRVVSDSTVSTCIKNARKALGDSGDQQRLIQTVRGRGVRFCARVTVCDDAQEEPPPDRSIEPAGDKEAQIPEPSLLILPFCALTGDDGTVLLADSLASDLGTILTRIPLLAISAGAPSYRNREIGPSVRDVYEQLGVAYVLEGDVRTFNGNYRANVQLSDARSGFRIWAESFVVGHDRADPTEQAVVDILVKLEPQLQRAIFNSLDSGSDKGTARLLFLESNSTIVVKGWRQSALNRAIELLRRSEQLDSEFALAPAYLSLMIAFSIRVGLSADTAARRAESLEAAERALELDSMDSNVLGYAGCAMADIDLIERALPLLRRAVDINPANAQAWAALGSVHLKTGDVQRAIDYLRRGIGISPLDSRLSVWGTLLALALLQDSKVDDALSEAQQACQRDDNNYMPRVALAAAHLARGVTSAARQSLGDAFRIKPDLDAEQIAALTGERAARLLHRLRR